MWEISAGQPSFSDYDDYDLAINIINGIRPKTISGIPSEYKELMEQCWDADPTKRPDIKTLHKKIKKMLRLIYQNEEQQTNDNTNIISSNPQFNTNYSMSFSLNDSFFGSSSSRVYKFKNLPQPRNATKGEILNVNIYLMYSNYLT